MPKTVCQRMGLCKAHIFELEQARRPSHVRIEVNCTYSSLFPLPIMASLLSFSSVYPSRLGHILAANLRAWCFPWLPKRQVASRKMTTYGFVSLAGAEQVQTRCAKGLAIHSFRRNVVTFGFSVKHAVMNSPPLGQQYPATRQTSVRYCIMLTAPLQLAT